jgi:hypothetical protein
MSAATLPRRLASNVRNVARRLAPFGTFLTVFAVAKELLPDITGSWSRYLISLGVATSSGLLIALLVQKQPPKPSDESNQAAPLFINYRVQRDLERLLVERVQTRTLIDGTTHVGWTHFLDIERLAEQPVTALSTAYGLKGLLLARYRLGGSVDISALRETIWSLSINSGLWSASSRPKVPRPEVSAIVLGALAMAGESRDRLVPSCQKVLDLMEPSVDPVGSHNTYVVSTVVRNLVAVIPYDDRLEGLARRVADNARTDEASATSYWTERLGPASAQPSVPNTAQALYAMKCFGSLRPDCMWALRVTRTAVNYLEQVSEAQTLGLVTQQIVRPHRSRQDIIVVRHFTAAWVLRALMSAGADTTTRAALAARDMVLRHRVENDGPWVWEDGCQPVWMAYQGTLALASLAENRPIEG